MARRRSILRRGEDSDPMSVVSNLFDVAMVFAVALMVALVSRYNMTEMFSQEDFTMVKNPGKEHMEIITKEGAKDSGQALENMSMDIDTLVEGVYRDQIDRKEFHKRFITFGLALFLLVMAMQFLLGTESYLTLIEMWYVQLILHAIIIINCFFLITGEKFYYEDVGVE